MHGSFRGNAPGDLRQMCPRLRPFLPVHAVRAVVAPCSTVIQAMNLLILTKQKRQARSELEDRAMGSSLWWDGEMDRMEEFQKHLEKLVCVGTVRRNTGPPASFLPRHHTNRG